MTIRPVYERPRVLRTLLCLLVGVLALLWRAVPSFSWDPSWCTPNQWHDHTMQAGDTAVFASAYYLTKQCPNDAFAIQWSPNGTSWYTASPNLCYTCNTWFRIATYGDPDGRSHYNDIKAQFCAVICNLHHDDADTAYTGSWYHSRGWWNTYGEQLGSEIKMMRFGA